MANGDCEEVFATFVGAEKAARVQGAAPLARPFPPPFRTRAAILRAR